MKKLSDYSRVPRVFTAGSLTLQNRLGISRQSILNRFEAGGMPAPETIIVDGHGEHPAWTLKTIDKHFPR